MAFDIASIDARAASEAGVDIEFVHPVTKEPTGFVVTVKGAYSQVFRDHLSRAVAKQAAERDARPQGTKVREADEPSEMAVALAGVTLGWRGLTENGKEVVFSRAEAERIYTHYDLIRTQVWAAVNNIANFIKG